MSIAKKVDLTSTVILKLKFSSVFLTICIHTNQVFFLTLRLAYLVANRMMRRVSGRSQPFGLPLSLSQPFCSEGWARISQTRHTFLHHCSVACSLVFFSLWLSFSARVSFLSSSSSCSLSSLLLVSLTAGLTAAFNAVHLLHFSGSWDRDQCCVFVCVCMQRLWVDFDPSSIP